MRSSTPEGEEVSILGGAANKEGGRGALHRSIGCGFEWSRRWSKWRKWKALEDTPTSETQALHGSKIAQSTKQLSNFATVLFRSSSRAGRVLAFALSMKMNNDVVVVVAVFVVCCCLLFLSVFIAPCYHVKYLQKRSIAKPYLRSCTTSTKH